MSGFVTEVGQQLCGDPALLFVPEIAAAALPSLSKRGDPPTPSRPAFLLSLEKFSLGPYFVWVQRTAVNEANMVPALGRLTRGRDMKHLVTSRVHPLDRALGTPGCGWVSGDEKKY